MLLDCSEGTLCQLNATEYPSVVRTVCLSEVLQSSKPPFSHLLF